MKRCILTGLAVMAFLFTCGPRLNAASAPVPVGTAYAQTTVPYVFVGMVFVELLPNSGLYGIGSGTALAPRSVLTAGHVVYEDGIGFVDSAEFLQALSGTARRRIQGTTKFILAGYSAAVAAHGSASPEAFAKDLGGLRLQRSAGNRFASWQNNVALLNGPNFRMSLGYGAAFHSGLRMLKSSPRSSFHKQLGAFYINSSYLLEPGMSGGPFFNYLNGNWTLVAVNVAGSGIDAGVRAINGAGAAFINTYLNH